MDHGLDFSGSPSCDSACFYTFKKPRSEPMGAGLPIVRAIADVFHSRQTADYRLGHAGVRNLFSGLRSNLAKCVNIRNCPKSSRQSSLETTTPYTQQKIGAIYAVVVEGEGLLIRSAKKTRP